MKNPPGKKRTDRTGLHEQDAVPDLFLFPCPVVVVAPGFVYWLCLGNVRVDTYYADTLVIKSL